MRIFQKGFNYSQDGPGNRLVFHLQGCNMRCPWCANPEGLDPGGVLMTDSKWLDPALCPHGAVKGRVLDRRVCQTCTGQECVHLHNGKGIRWSCEEVGTEELLAEIASAQMMFYDGGGVTFTGGECTLQFDELLTVLRALKKTGIDTAIETNGTHPRLPDLFPYIDHLIMDCKLIDADAHKKIMGVSNERILQNIRRAAEVHPCVHICIPLIGGVNNGAKETRDFLDFFQSLPQTHLTYEVLKYHEYGKRKWAECGLAYAMDEGARVTAEEVHACREQIERAGLRYQKT